MNTVWRHNGGKQETMEAGQDGISTGWRLDRREVVQD